MNDKRYNELMQIYLLNEISAEEKIELENYLLENDKAKKEFEEMKKLHRTFASNRPVPLSDRVLDESRQTLLRRIRAEETQESGFTKFINSIKNIFAANYKYALSGVATLAVGLFLGYMFFSPSQPRLMVEDQNQFDIDKIRNGGIDISNIRFNNQFADNGDIEFSFNAVKPVTYKGNISDELTLKLLAMALISSDNPGIRLKSLNTIASQTVKNITPDAKIKSSMISALKTDENAGVRKEALNILMKYPFDDEIRDAFLFVLQNDRNSGMRVAAINALTDLKQQGKSIDQEIRNVLSKQAESAENNFIRLRAASLLQEVK
jgi:hypothetical protein